MDTQLSPQDDYVGWICALPSELAASQAMLDKPHREIRGVDTQDRNIYVIGKMNEHNVVIACLPAGVDGTNAAATVAKDMTRTFKALRFVLLVGIGGGIPNLEQGIDVRLGDVVVSQPSGTNGGVIQYDKGKALTGDAFERKGMLNAPPTALLNALTSVQARHYLEDSQMSTYITDMFKRYPKMQRTGYTFPGADKDVLYDRSYDQMDRSGPGGATIPTHRTEAISRHTRDGTQPKIHYGVIASGNMVIKNARDRDFLRDEYGALCVEMEAAGLMNECPCLVIRGICDYADSHKNDAWHNYAATTAAAYAKELLLQIPPAQAQYEKPMTEALG
jgi:nucleoside phosphorylase